MTIKTAAKSVGNGLLNGINAIHNDSIHSQIEELDEQLEALSAQIADLQQKKTKLKDQLV